MINTIIIDVALVTDIVAKRQVDLIIKEMPSSGPGHLENFQQGCLCSFFCVKFDHILFFG